MAGKVLRMKLFTKFELWCFVSTFLLKTATTQSPQTLGASVKTDTATIKRTDIEMTGTNIINQPTVCRHDRPTLLYFLFFPTTHFLKTIFRLTNIAHICKPHKPTHCKGGINKRDIKNKYQLVFIHTARRTLATQLYEHGLPLA